MCERGKVSVFRGSGLDDTAPPLMHGAMPSAHAH